MAFDDSGAVVGAQADSIDVSSDGLTYTIKIKPGWTFHDGTPGDRAVLRRCVELRRIRTQRVHPQLLLRQDRGLRRPQPHRREHPQDEGAVRAEGGQRHAVQRRRSAPFSQFDTRSGSTRSTRCRRRSTTTRRFDEQPIGDGPYMMDGKWQHDQAINLQRYPDYAGTPGFADNDRAAHLSGRRRVAGLPGGEPGRHVRGVVHLNEGQAHLRRHAVGVPGASLLYLKLPLYDPQFQNKELRQALSWRSTANR